MGIAGLRRTNPRQIAVDEQLALDAARPAEQVQVDKTPALILSRTDSRFRPPLARSPFGYG